MSLVIGLTGGIASGKSTVAEMFREFGFPIIDADIEARLAVEPGESAYFKIVEAFGKEILHEDGKIDRMKLGAIIFNSSEKRLILNAIVHPEVRRRMTAKKDALASNCEKLIILDIPLLFESKLEYLADKTLLVYTDRAIQLARLMKRNGFSLEEAEARIQSQMPLQDKSALADAVINNNGTQEETKAQLISILHSWGISGF